MIVDGVDPWLPDQGTETLDEGFWFKEQGAWPADTMRLGEESR